MPRLFVRAPGLVLAALLSACLALAAPARAEPLGPYYEFDSLAERGYELRLSLAYYSAERSDFRQLVFLMPQPVQRISVFELRSELDFRFSLTRQLAVQAIVPLALREADVQLQDVLVSLTQVLPGRTLELPAAGMPDPTLALGYRVLQTEMFRFQLELGTRIPVDDNPGSPIVPERLPLGTGQNLLFVGAGGGLRAGRFDLALGYRFEYVPGSTATYLVRQIGTQGSSSGALDTFTAHRISAAVWYWLDEVWAAQLAPEFRADEQPSVVDRDGSSAFLAERFRYDLLFAAAIQARLSWQHTLRLGYSQPLLHAWDEDPFFPITVPEQGLRLTWIFSAR